MALDPAEKKEVQSAFQSWLEIQDTRKELTQENKAVVEGAAQILGKKNKVVTKLFAALKQKMDNGEDELQEVYDVMAEMEV